MRLTSGFSRSARVVTEAFAAGTISASAFRVKSLRVAGIINCFACASSMNFWLAGINTSTGAPCAICCSNAPDDAKLNVTLTDGSACSNALPISVKAFVRLAAAETIIFCSCVAISAADALFEDHATDSMATRATIFMFLSIRISNSLSVMLLMNLCHSIATPSKRFCRPAESLLNLFTSWNLSVNIFISSSRFSLSRRECRNTQPT